MCNKVMLIDLIIRLTKNKKVYTIYIFFFNLFVYLYKLIPIRKVHTFLYLFTSVYF